MSGLEESTARPAITRRLIPALLATGLLSIVLAIFAWTQVSGDDPFHGTVYPDAPLATDFTLTRHDGERVSLSDHRGSIALVFFGFSNCPDVCPLTLRRLAQVLGDGGIGPDEARVLLVTVDPANDSPAVLAEYVKPFAPWTIGLTGTAEEIDRVKAAYGVYAERTEGHDGHETLAHNGVVFGIDRAGRLRVLIHPEESAETVLDDVRTLLAFDD